MRRFKGARTISSGGLRGFLFPFSFSLLVSFILALSISFTGGVDVRDVPVNLPSIPIRFVGFKPLDLSKEKERPKPIEKKPKPVERKLKVYRMALLSPCTRVSSGLEPKPSSFPIDFDVDLPFSEGPHISVPKAGGVLSPKPGVGHGIYGDSSPVLVSYVKPFYPFRAREMGIEGVVVVKLLVDEKGRVKKVKVLKSSPPGVFERSVISAVRSWRFIPAKEDGRPVPCWVVKPIKFKLGG